MDFEKAFEFASGEISREELKQDMDINLERINSQSTRISTQTGETLDGTGSLETEGPKKDNFLKFGWYQLFLVILLGIGINSGSWIIFPLAYLELQPDFLC